MYGHTPFVAGWREKRPSNALVDQRRTVASIRAQTVCAAIPQGFEASIAVGTGRHSFVTHDSKLCAFSNLFAPRIGQEGCCCVVGVVPLLCGRKTDNFRSLTILPSTKWSFLPHPKEDPTMVLCSFVSCPRKQPNNAVVWCLIFHCRCLLVCWWVRLVQRPNSMIRLWGSVPIAHDRFTATKMEEKDEYQLR